MPEKKAILEMSIRAFLDRISSLSNLRDKIILQLLFETGCSVNELCSIKVSDYILPTDYMQLNKMRFSDRSSVISETLSCDIKKYILFRKRHSDEYLFSQNVKKPLSVKRVEQLVIMIYDNKVRPMHIRYMHIVHAASKGLSPDTISEQTGLSRQRILQILDAYNVRYRQSYSLFFEEYGGKNE
ncbi:MAG: tyrosine-type recombinase/integrase [Candidatus Woesearchaeota archaeon]